MKQVTYVVTPHTGYFDPTEKWCRENDLRFEAIHQLGLLEDGTVKALLEVAGTPSQVRSNVPDDLSRLVDRELSADDGRTMVQLRYEPTDLNRRFIEPFRTSGVIVQYPIVYVDPDRSSLRTTITGPDDDIQGLIESYRGLADLTVEAVSSSLPSVDQRYDDLTERQQEVLVTAYEHGYYADPRGATYEEIAAELDCSASSVGQILRRTESTLVSATVANRPHDSS